MSKKHPFDVHRQEREREEDERDSPHGVFNQLCVRANVIIQSPEAKHQSQTFGENDDAPDPRKAPERIYRQTHIDRNGDEVYVNGIRKAYQDERNAFIHQDEQRRITMRGHNLVLMPRKDRQPRISGMKVPETIEDMETLLLKLQKQLLNTQQLIEASKGK